MLHAQAVLSSPSRLCPQQEAPELRERNFGGYELQSCSNYERVWADDAEDPGRQPPGAGAGLMRLLLAGLGDELLGGASGLLEALPQKGEEMLPERSGLGSPSHSRPWRTWPSFPHLHPAPTPPTAAASYSGGGESVQDVAQRLRGLIERLEAAHAGRHIVLVSHGDALSVLAAVLLGGDLWRHRQHGLPNCGILRVPAAAA